jgi:hypothetical protein
MVVVFNKQSAFAASWIGVLLWTSVLCAQVAGAEQATQHPFEAAHAPGKDTPTPAEPYPFSAAGWGPELGNGLLVSRWAENWIGMRALGHAPMLKAMPIGDAAFLTLSAESRLRYDSYQNGQLILGHHQLGLFRGVLGADLRFNPNLRVYAELGTAQVNSRRNKTTANFQNAASLQQLFVDARGYLDATLLGIMLGRQEFADGPRQLISLSDGPNLHRTWNGVRLYMHAQRFRVGVFELRATRLDHGAFDEKINNGERLQGLNASFVVSSQGSGNAYLDPFWIHSENPNFRDHERVGLDNRDTFGVRLWGRQGDFRFDWTLAQQSGQYMSRNIHAWGIFAVHSLTLAHGGWQPRLTAHIDIASGGGVDARGAHQGFNPLYASSNYLGEGQFLSLSNLFIIAPGIAVSPTPATNFSVEYGVARRRNQSDAAYGGGMRAYSGTQSVPGHEIGGLLRVVGTWSASAHWSLFCNYEHLVASGVLKRAGLSSGSYVQVGATFRY